MLAAGQVLIILSGTDMSAPWLLWTGAAVSGIGLAPIFGSVFALFAQYGMPPPGRVVGLMWCLTNAGDILAQNIASVRNQRQSLVPDLAGLYKAAPAMLLLSLAGSSHIIVVR